MNRRSVIVPVLAMVLAVIACGPSRHVAMSGTGTGGSSGSSSGNPECPDTHEGDLLEITEATDVEPLRTVRRVMGNVSIHDTSLVGLSFLECLEQIDGELKISGNEQLVDLAGLENLESVGGDLEPIDNWDGVLIYSNPGLVSLAGLDRVTYLRKLSVIGNSSLSYLALGQLREVERLELGGCRDPADVPPPWSDSALTKVNGLESLERVNGLVVGGQNHLLSLGALHGTVTDATGGFEFYYNTNLPYSEIEKLFEGTGREATQHCGNQDDPVDVCNEGFGGCPGPD